MTLAQLLIAISAWCSTPSYGTMSIEPVNACRKSIMTCAGEPDQKGNFDTKLVLACFKVQQLNR